MAAIAIVATNKGDAAALHRASLAAFAPRLQSAMYALWRRTRRLGDARLQLFRRYPVLKIHATMARQIVMNTSVIARLIPTPTSDTP